MARNYSSGNAQKLYANSLKRKRLHCSTVDTEAALEAAKSRDVDAILEVGNQIIDACERCHEKYWIR